MLHLMNFLILQWPRNCLGLGLGLAAYARADFWACPLERLTPTVDNTGTAYPGRYAACATASVVCGG